MEIDINKKYTTRDGRPVTILKTNLLGTQYPVCGFITTPNGNEVVNSWTNEGYIEMGEENGSDLVEFKTKKVGYIGIFNEMEDGRIFCSHIYATKELAEDWKKNKEEKCIIVKVEWEE